MTRNYDPSPKRHTRLDDRQLKSLKLMLVDCYPSYAIRERFGLTDGEIREYAKELGIKRTHGKKY